MAPSERQFELPGITLAAQEWGAGGGVPVLAAHGWLDNAGSFDLLAPLLGGAYLLALDLAGHGSSSFRSPDASYNLWRDVDDLIEVADQLEWQRFNVLGHSRGAAIAMLLAATFPERVDKLVLLEGGVPMIGTAEDAPGTLAQALADRRSLRRKSGRVFTNRDTAIAERADGFSKVSTVAAGILARRSLREVSGGFQWHADQRLKGSSELRLTAEHVRAFVSKVKAPVLMILAEQSPFGHSAIYQEMISRFAQIEVLRLPGGHHFHLEGAQSVIAERIRRFYGLTS